MLTVDQALEAILSRINVLETEDRPLLDCLGQITAENVFADVNVPNWDSSAQDGFAVKAEDIKGASLRNPRVLRVIETVGAGFKPQYKVEPGTATRIMTGAPIPIGANCVVRFEDTDEKQSKKEITPEKIGILHAEKPGNNINKAGNNIAKGELALSKGSVIGPAEINITASLGYSKMKVMRRPIVAIISTGEELVNPGKPLSYGQIYSGYIYSLAAQVLRCGGIPRIIGIARDKKYAIMAKIRQGMAADMVITSGGVSMGDYDLVKDILAEIGEIIFWQVRMSPGKPFAFALLHKVDRDGKAKNVPHFALAGNPSASMVNFEVLVRPAILKMLGNTKLETPFVEAVLEESLDNKKATRRFAWVKVDKRNGGYYARPTSSQVKGVLPSIALADGLAIIPEETLRAEKGDKLKVIMLDWHRAQ